MSQLIEALRWYAEQARLCRLIHDEGDAGRQALAADGGAKAREALAAAEAMPVAVIETTGDIGGRVAWLAHTGRPVKVGDKLFATPVSAAEAQPVAEVIEYGAGAMGLRWADDAASSRAKPGPLYAAPVAAAQPAPEPFVTSDMLRAALDEFGRQHQIKPSMIAMSAALHAALAAAPAPQPTEERRQLRHLLDDIVEEAEQDGATYYRIRDGKDILFSNLVGACARLLAQPEAPAPQPLKPLTPEQMRELMEAAGYTGSTPQAQADFINGVRHGELAHGIKGAA